MHPRAMQTMPDIDNMTRLTNDVLLCFEPNYLLLIYWCMHFVAPYPNFYVLFHLKTTYLLLHFIKNLA